MKKENKISRIPVAFFDEGSTDLIVYDETGFLVVKNVYLAGTRNSACYIGENDLYLIDDQISKLVVHRLSPNSLAKIGDITIPRLKHRPTASIFSCQVIEDTLIGQLDNQRLFSVSAGEDLQTLAEIPDSAWELSPHAPNLRILQLDDDRILVASGYRQSGSAECSYFIWDWKLNIKYLLGRGKMAILDLWGNDQNIFALTAAYHTYTHVTITFWAFNPNLELVWRNSVSCQIPPNFNFSIARQSDKRYIPVGSGIIEVRADGHLLLHRIPFSPDDHPCIFYPLNNFSYLLFVFKRRYAKYQLKYTGIEAYNLAAPYDTFPKWLAFTTADDLVLKNIQPLIYK